MLHDPSDEVCTGCGLYVEPCGDSYCNSCCPCESLDDDAYATIEDFEGEEG